MEITVEEVLMRLAIKDMELFKCQQRIRQLEMELSIYKVGELVDGVTSSVD